MATGNLQIAHPVLGGEDEALWYGGLSWSPSGSYLAYATVKLSKLSDMFPPFVLSTAVRVAPTGTITVVNPRAEPISWISVDLEANIGGGWTLHDKLLIVCRNGIRRNHYVLLLYSPSGHLLERRVFEESDSVLKATVSPNGRYLAYLTADEEACVRYRLVIRCLDDLHIAAVLPIESTALIDDIAWSPDGRRVAVVGGEFVWFCNLDSTNRPNMQQVRRTEYYGGKISVDRGILINASFTGLGVIPVYKPESVAHYSVGPVDKFGFNPKAHSAFAALLSRGSRSNEDKSKLLVWGTVRGSIIAIRNEIARGSIADFCWHPDGDKIAYLTKDGRVAIVDVSIEK